MNNTFLIKMRYLLPVLSLVLLLAVLSSACNAQIANALTCRDALEKGIYDQQIQVKGTVSRLGKLGGNFFILSSGGRELTVYYGSMVEDNGNMWPKVSIANIADGDNVIVTGELKSAGKNHTQNSFWTRSIRKY